MMKVFRLILCVLMLTVYVPNNGPWKAEASSLVPTGVTAVGSSGKVDLKWGSVGGADSYNVKRSLAPGGPYTKIENVSTTDFEDTNVTNGNTYYYVVSAVSTAGESENSIVAAGTPGEYLIYDNYENSSVGDVPEGYKAPIGSNTPSSFESDNNATVINNTKLANSFGNSSGAIAENDSNVLWVNDSNARRGGFNKAFTPVTAESEKGLTASADFMQPKVMGDSYVLELLDSNNKTALSFRVGNSPRSISPNTWYNVKYVADVKANTADLFINGEYYGNFPFASPVTDIASINVRTPGTSTGSSYEDNVAVAIQEVTTPQNLTAVGSNHKAELTWNAASGVDSYNVYRSDKPNGVYEKIASDVKTNSYSNFDEQNLINDKEYFYMVTSVHQNAESAFSNIGKAYVNNVPPPSAEITNFKAEARDSQFSLSWDPVSEATYYTLERSTTSEGPFVQLLEGNSEKIEATSYLDTHLRNGVAYYYKLTAWNPGGAGSKKLLEKVTSSSPLNAPVVYSPKSLSNQVDLHWTTVKGADHYNVSRSTVSGGPYEFIATVRGTSYSDDSAKNGQIYYYVVTASNENVTSMISNQVKARPYEQVSGTRKQPKQFEAVAYQGKVSLSWEPTSDAASYNVKRSEKSGGPYTNIKTTSENSFEDVAVTDGTTYYYVITAVNKNGESQSTDEMAVQPAKVLTVDKNAAADGVTVFNSIQSAVDTIPANNNQRIIVYIAEGTYKEKLEIKSPYVSLVGDGIDKTVITYGDYAGSPSTQGKPGYTGNTFLSQTVKVEADHFNASNLTIENSAGPRNEVVQAVALNIKSDKASFESVKLKGYQDTLYNGNGSNQQGRQYFNNSIIEGDVDFIFGEASAVVLNNNRLVLVSNVPEGTSAGGHITAAAQAKVTDNGYVILNSQIVDGSSAKGTYDLGRAWKDYARVSYINTLIDSNNFDRNGWSTSCAGSCKQSYFFEYNSYGPGADASSRIISTQLTGAEASMTIPQIFDGWDPTVQVVMPHVKYQPAVEATNTTFDQNAEKQGDIHALVQGNGKKVTKITNGKAVLKKSDYTVEGNVLTINKSYLAGLADGRTTLEVHFANVAVPLTINVINSTINLGKETLPVNDGWGSFTTGTTGGSKADSSHIFTVSNRSELIEALGGNNSTNDTNSTPKIIYVKGTIDMNVDENNKPVGMEFYKDPAYDFEKYLEAYNPDSWGRDSVPSGELEDARKKSEQNQANNIQIKIGSNTTIVGLPGTNAKILGGNLIVQNVDNVIIRNIGFENTFDYFPQWDPTDGSMGNWNSAFDTLTIKNATHVWLDHNTFSDGSMPDDQANTYFGRQYQQHDGLMDITNASDLITVSYNHFHDHDKTTLVGGSDSYTEDEGKERVTFHHNYYQNVTERAPRVRYGQVHVYNNYYEGTNNHASYSHSYSLGIGFKSQIYAQNNYFTMDEGAATGDVIQVWGGTQFTDIGTILNGEKVELTAGTTLSPVDWTPLLYTSMNQTEDVPEIVKANAGAGHLIQGR
ncbi:pectinesterase family protein [Mesobacillus maritimus]|uniref:pectinesterase family protein n=1 Tax=Mesobacillus maritimus TaxID=1643336 RepID=UPI00384E7D95